MTKKFLMSVIVGSVLSATASADTKPLNDTGAVSGALYPSGNNGTCSGVSIEAQDCSYGRDALALSNGLNKVGSGVAGFDFSKMSNTGSILPSGALLGTGPSDWGCTLDNTTGLLWEVKQTTGLHSQSHTYSWFNSNPLLNGGQSGTPTGGVCQTVGRCDTEKFVTDVNAEGLCGFNDWRMPSSKELLSIVDFGTVTRIVDTAFFPDLIGAKPYSNPTPSFWTGIPYASQANSAISVVFSFGADGPKTKDYPYKVRLVRNQQ